MTSLRKSPEQPIIADSSSPPNEFNMETSSLQQKQSTFPSPSPEPTNVNVIEDTTDSTRTVTVETVKAAETVTADEEKKIMAVASEATKVEVLDLKTRASNNNTVVACDQVKEVSVTLQHISLSDNFYGIITATAHHRSVKASLLDCDC